MNEITDATLKTPNFPTWCPGCGDFGIWGAIKKALTDLAIPEEKLVIVFDIGCSGNMADFLRVYGFHALHGRALPTAEGIKLANQDMKILVIGGDGGIYGEGMGHFIASCRGNHDITLLVHDNQTYGLTTGQSSPTTEKGIETKSTPQGLIEQPVNPVGLAVTANATWVGRGYAGDINYTAELLKQAMSHKGFALLDVFQPCVTFNKHNTHMWFQQKVYKLETEGYQPTDRGAAWMKAQETEKLPIGVFYKDETQPAYHEQIPLLKEKALVQQFGSEVSLASLLKEFV